MSRLASLVGLLAILLVVNPMDGSAGGAEKTILRVVGSTCIAPRLDTLAKEFVKTNKNVNIVVSGGHTSEGLRRLIAGNAEVAMASRKANSDEKTAASRKGVKLVETTIGWGTIVIITHPKTGVRALTVDQVTKIFKGELKNWRQVGGQDHPIYLVLMNNPDSGTLSWFKENVLSDSNYGVAARQVQYFRAVWEIVSKLPGSVGFCRTEDLDILMKKGDIGLINFLFIKKDEGSRPIPPARSISGDTPYPIKRRYYLYYNGKSRDQSAKRFVEFCLSK
jgi:phosphate transport system substrate-binding protein